MHSAYGLFNVVQTGSMHINSICTLELLLLLQIKTKFIHMIYMDNNWIEYKNFTIILIVFPPEDVTKMENNFVSSLAN